MRRAGRIVALALAKVGSAMRPGITTRELDALAEETIRSLGAIPAFLGFNGFPATACISINEQVVHGIPGIRPVKAGNLVKVDLGAIVEGWYADAAYTFPVGEVSELAQRLMACGQGALAAGIEAARAGKPRAGYWRRHPTLCRRHGLFRGARLVRAWHRPAFA